ncbi:MAG: EF-hand domain-containing protein [Pseudomonadota bacterium]
MSKYLVGGAGAIMLLLAGFLYMLGNAQEETSPDAEPPPQETAPADSDLPDADTADLVGPEPPEATEMTREERRFARYDRDSDRRITRNEMLSTRSKAFRKLDVDGNNLLTFEEWAVRTVDRFEGADADGDNELTPEEFATTKPQRRNRAQRCKC